MTSVDLSSRLTYVKTTSSCAGNRWGGERTLHGLPAHVPLKRSLELMDRIWRNKIIFEQGLVAERTDLNASHMPYITLVISPIHLPPATRRYTVMGSLPTGTYLLPDVASCNYLPATRESGYRDIWLSPDWGVPSPECHLFSGLSHHEITPGYVSFHSDWPLATQLLGSYSQLGLDFTINFQSKIDRTYICFRYR